MKLKKNPKVSLRKWSTTFFLLGLSLMLFISWRAMEWKSFENQNGNQEVLYTEEDLEMDIPITNQVTPPPPPPPPAATIPQVINVVEDTEEIEETVFESSETDQNQDIVEFEKIENIEEFDEEEEIPDAPFAVIEDVPIYPGCENKTTNQSRKDCMAEKIMEYVQKRFNTELASELGLEGRQRINVQFKIDNNGKVSNVRARAPHSKLEEEAINVVRSLPNMVPGKQRGKPVGVLYSLPILFVVENVD